jgi:hypothetical protein
LYRLLSTKSKNAVDKNCTCSLEGKISVVFAVSVVITVVVGSSNINPSTP